MYDAKTLERFWGKVDRSGGPEACWPWTGGVGGGKSPRRKPRFVLAHGRNVYARAFALELAGDSSTGPIVYDTCGNVMCCNPAHLRRGTAKEVAERNAEHDAIPKGERHAFAKLTDDAARTLRLLMLEGRVTATTLAVQTGMAPGTLYSIRDGRAWRHVAQAGDPVRPPTRHSGGKLWPSSVVAIRSAVGMPAKVLASEYAVTPETVRRIRRGETWRDAGAAPVN